MRREAGARGVTLIEVLVIVAIVGLMSGFVMLGAGVATAPACAGAR